MKSYLQTIFREFNTRHKNTHYYLDENGNIYFSNNGQINSIGNVSDIDYITIGNFNFNICLQGKLIKNEKVIPGRYLLTSDGPELTTEYKNWN